METHTWLQFGLGYRVDAPLPGTEGKQKAPAIAIPWFAGNKLVAIRYRFLGMQHYKDGKDNPQEAKQTSEGGSKFTGRLFGGQALPDWVTMPAPEDYQGTQKFYTLLIVEGELNAMSCWQAAGDTHLHVLSIGSRGATLTAGAIGIARKYGKVFVWADEDIDAQELMKQIPGAVGIKSPKSVDAPKGTDANDMLRDGELGGFLALRRELAAGTDDAAAEALLWDLYDAATHLAGIDTETARVLRRLATRLGKEAAIYQPQPGRWITP